MPKPKNKSKPTRTDWGPVADWYDQLVGESGSEYHREVVIPGILRMLGTTQGNSVIDIACGQGVLCRAMRVRGLEVTGVDAAKELIAAARERGPESIRYLVGDARDLSFLPPDHFHAATCVLAVQNIQPIKPVFEGAARILRPGGRLVIVLLHPCFRGAKETSWGWDESTKTQYRRVDRYLVPRKAPIVMHPGSDDQQYTWTFHRPLEMYFKAIGQSGLMVDALEEWPSHRISTSGPRAAAENTSRREIPMFLTLRAVKAVSQSL